MKKLYRSTKDKKIMGVCGGLGQYFGMDPTIIRLAWVILSVAFTFIVGGILIYFVCGLIIPRQPDYIDITVVNEVDD
ncbi:MAG: PspC domain-containing protein [Clostridia bacterium]|nr:PspC domain-containing protein [Clostridia bacterium]